MSEIVALLLDDAMPPQRLGALLLAARKRRGLKRKEAAAAAGTTAAMLRAYEHGDRPVPADICTRLVECYGDDLTAHVPRRTAPQIDNDALVVADVRRPLGTDPDDVLVAFVDIIHRLRDTAPGDPIALRAVDVVALAGTLGRDRDAVERRIAEILGCTPTEARRLHGELLRRKVILPVAGLAAGMAAFAGIAYAQTPVSTPATTTPASVAATSTTSTTSTSAPPASTSTTTIAAPPAAAAVATTTPTTTRRTGATVPADQRPAEVPVSIAPPPADPLDPPVSVLPGETPITIIGAPNSSAPNSAPPTP